MVRPLLASLGAGLVLLTASACLNTEAPLTPSPAVSASETASPTATTAAPTKSATPSPTASFPASARLYAEAVLLAWRTKQYGQLGELTTPAVLSQLQTTANVEPNWAYVNCQGAAGSSYCLFINGDGDAITLRLDNQLLGKARATTEVKLDQTTYSTALLEYVVWSSLTSVAARARPMSWLSRRTVTASPSALMNRQYDDPAAP